MDGARGLVGRAMDGGAAEAGWLLRPGPRFEDPGPARGTGLGSRARALAVAGRTVRQVVGRDVPYSREGVMGRRTQTRQGTVYDLAYGWLVLEPEPGDVGGERGVGRVGGGGGDCGGGGGTGGGSLVPHGEPQGVPVQHRHAPADGAALPEYLPLGVGGGAGGAEGGSASEGARGGGEETDDVDALREGEGAGAGVAAGGCAAAAGERAAPAEAGEGGGCGRCRPGRDRGEAAGRAR